jgi:hypothetical protein
MAVLWGSNMMNEAQILQLVRENERMKTALRSIWTYASQASIGGWRSAVIALVKNGLYPQ